MAQLTWEYIAAFFDGEGCVSTYSNRSRRGETCGTSATLVQSGERGKTLLSEIMEFMAKTGVRSYSRMAPASVKRLGRQPIYQLKVACRPSLLVFLKAILPYCRIKKVVVQDTLRFLILTPPILNTVFKELNEERKRNGWYQQRRDGRMNRIDRTKAEFASGMTREGIAEKHGLHLGTVYAYLNGH